MLSWFTLDNSRLTKLQSLSNLSYKNIHECWEKNKTRWKHRHTWQAEQCECLQTLLWNRKVRLERTHDCVPAYSGSQVGLVSKRKVWQKVLMKTRLLSQYRLKIHCICHCEHSHLLIANIKKALQVHLLKCLAQAMYVQGKFLKIPALGKTFLLTLKC